MKAIEKALKQVIHFPHSYNAETKRVTGLMPDGQKISVSYRFDLGDGNLPNAVFTVCLDDTHVWGNTQMKGGLTDDETAQLIRMHHTAERAVYDTETRVHNENKNKFQDWLNS